jgi:sterol desaturase/sphingolipid hydroxylase (fatty acid hydroxylase superfamily)
MSWLRIENAAYWAVFAAAFTAIAVWQTARPARRLSVSVDRRWGNHALLMLTCSALSMLLFRGSAIMLAVAVERSNFGLLNRTSLPLPVRVVLTILALDFVRYAVHWLHHSIAFLWRVHQVHHSDPDCDLSTGLRSHPIEALLLQGAYFGAIVILAAPPVAVLASDLASLFQSFLSHANTKLPEWIEKPLRLTLVTPEMHAIHHSVEVKEQSRNLGDIFPWWDRLFGTYLHEPAAGHGEFVLGLKGFQNERSLGYGFMLAQPFRRGDPSEGSNLPDIVRSA